MNINEQLSAARANEHKFGDKILRTLDDGGKGGTFSPETVELTADKPSATFTYEPSKMNLNEQQPAGPDFRPPERVELERQFSEMNVVAVQYEAGLFARGSIRNFLEEQKFLRSNFDWRETKNFGMSTFTIKGDAETVRALSAAIDHWAAATEQVSKG